MIDITPTVGSDEELNVGDGITLKWLISSQADEDDIEFRIFPDNVTLTGNDLTESTEEIDGVTWYRYEAKHILQNTQTKVEFALEDDVNSALDLGYIKAERKLS